MNKYIHTYNYILCYFQEHRVIIPASSEERKKIRSSLVFFLYPDLDTLIPPRTSAKYSSKNAFELFEETMHRYYPDLNCTPQK